ncbi:cytochrome p450 [Colletotrichum truncatum]|uniref:Cytochrome p450 n=1 Tax=Colletotrichum truncatum TaxID=5467 RepID=A0ACC3Z5C6_COLTU|nr:cytochrome p450 [Colletotrichum truncatum]KAF6795185.1 cytochrome p450 [Colletotrichum truncatum]
MSRSGVVGKNGNPAILGPVKSNMEDPWIPDTRALRIGPNELHISDSTLYHTLYSQDHAFAKHPYFYEAFMTPHSVFVETDRSLHRQRRKMLNNFFSKSSIRGMQHLLYEKVNNLCTIVSGMDKNHSLNIYNAVRCMTIDIISDLGFGRSFGLTDNAKGSQFEAEFLKVFDIAADSIWDLIYFPLIRTVLNKMPPAFINLLGGPAAHMIRLSEAIQDVVARFRATQAAGKSPEHETIFDGLSELDDREMLAEATDIIIAGSDTTATTLAVAVHQLTCNPDKYDTLKTEIQRANLKSARDYDLKDLEKLSYLSACVKEALRFASAVPGRLPRIVPPPQSKTVPLIVDQKVIPPGTVVGMSAYTVHTDKEIWGDDAREFKPERWLEPEGKQLEKYLVTFSKGARQCLGINLAYAEITLALAMFMSRFNFEKDTTLSKEDLELRDSFTFGFVGSGPCVKVSSG